MVNAKHNKYKLSFKEVWFTDQNSKQIEIEGNVNMALIVG